VRILLYAEAARLISKSGIGTAYKQQIEALKRAGVDYTCDWEDIYDIAHVNTVGPSSRMVVEHCKKKNIPVIWHVHTTAEDIRNSFIFSNFYARISQKWLKKLYSKADYLIFPTKYTESIIRGYGIKIPGTVLSNGIDTEIFKKNDEKAKQFLKKFGLSKPIVLSVGFPFKRKGIHDFVAVARKMRNYTFVWLGAKITSVLPRDVREMIKNPPQNVIFPGFLNREELVGAYSAADVFFFPTYEENEGIVVLEALSCECPVVVRDIPVYRDWLENGVNCLKGNSNDDFEALIEKLIVDKNLSDKLSREGRKVAFERDLSNIGRALREIYENILGRCTS